MYLKHNHIHIFQTYLPPLNESTPLQIVGKLNQFLFCMCLAWFRRLYHHMDCDELYWYYSGVHISENLQELLLSVIKIIEAYNNGNN